MARIFITGSSDGLGSIVAQRLITRGHTVVLHARNAQRAQDATAACPGAESVIIGDMSTIAGSKRIAVDANAVGTFDCVIHNAGLFRGPYRGTIDGIPALAAVNTLAPYILTCLMNRPKRLVFLSSSMHYHGNGSLDDPLWVGRGEKAYNDVNAYCDSKVHDIMFAKAFARRWSDVTSNALDPGWVPTKMGGQSAPGSIEAAVDTYIMLAEGKTNSAQRSGKYYEPGQLQAVADPTTDSEEKQERLLDACAEFTGINVPA